MCKPCRKTLEAYLTSICADTLETCYTIYLSYRCKYCFLCMHCPSILCMQSRKKLGLWISLSIFFFFLGIFGGDKIVEFAQCCKLIILFYLYLCNIALGDSCHQRIK